MAPVREENCAETTNSSKRRFDNSSAPRESSTDRYHDGTSRSLPRRHAALKFAYIMLAIACVPAPALTVSTRTVSYNGATYSAAVVPAAL